MKIQKEVLMKKLTVANENKDLHTLLSIEMEWMALSGNNDNPASRSSSDEQLKIYNSILKDQIEELEEILHMSYSHPKYILIQKYISHPFIPCMQLLHMDFINSQNAARNYKLLTAKVQDKRAPETLRKLLKGRLS